MEQLKPQKSIFLPQSGQNELREPNSQSKWKQHLIKMKKLLNTQKSIMIGILSINRLGNMLRRRMMRRREQCIKMCKNGIISRNKIMIVVWN